MSARARAGWLGHLAPADAVHALGGLLLAGAHVLAQWVGYELTARRGDDGEVSFRSRRSCAALWTTGQGPGTHRLRQLIRILLVYNQPAVGRNVSGGMGGLWLSAQPCWEEWHVVQSPWMVDLSREGVVRLRRDSLGSAAQEVQVHKESGYEQRKACEDGFGRVSGPLSPLLLTSLAAAIA